MSATLALAAAVLRTRPDGRSGDSWVEPCIAARDEYDAMRKEIAELRARLGADRKLIGYRVVRTNADTRNREYLATLADASWHQRRSFMYRSEHAARDDAEQRGGRVVAVYLTVKPRGGAR